MAYPYTQLYGDITLNVTATATGAVDGSTSQKIDVSAGLPVVDQLADLLVRFKIPKASHLDNNKQLKFKVTFSGSDLDNGSTFAAQSVRDGDSIVLEDV